MNKTDIAKLLTLASGFDRRVVDPVTVEAWALVPEIVAADYEAAKAAVVAHQTGPKAGEYLTVNHIVAALNADARRSDSEIEADVRSAKARGLIESSWPNRQPLPADVKHGLQSMRELDRRNAAAFSELDALEGRPIDVGDVGRRP